MSKKALLSLLGLVIFSFIYISACENPGSTLEESVAPYLELQAVEGASNVTMTVNRGNVENLDSYFAVDFTNFDSNGLVSEGITEGWCLDYSKPIEQNNDVHQGIKMFSTHGSEDWKSANYLMNIKDELKANDPSLTYREIQVALWSLIKVPSFNIAKALNNGSMPSRLMTNGSPNFDVNKTKQIVNKVKSEVSNFEYKLGTPSIVYAKTSSGNTLKQPTAIVKGETSWAYVSKQDGTGTVDTQMSASFCEEDNMKNNRWGWSSFIPVNTSNLELTIIAGAGNCNVKNGTEAGIFKIVSFDGEDLTYEVRLNAINDYKKVKIHAGTTFLPINSKDEYDTASGKFVYESNINNDPSNNVNQGTASGTISGLGTTNKDGVEGIFIAVKL